MKGLGHEIVLKYFDENGWVFLGLQGGSDISGTLSNLRLFLAQMALASLVTFQGPKKSRFSGPTPSNAPRNDVALLKTITYRAIKTTGTLIVIELKHVLSVRLNLLE